MADFIDSDGFRANVGIILANSDHLLFWAGRAGGPGWQFPQGGIHHDETAEAAMYRELAEEIGLRAGDVQVLGCTQEWLRYRLPRRYRRYRSRPLCIGQKQRWFLLRMACRDHQVRLDATAMPEFDRWRWVDFWHPLSEVVYFKRRVYARALQELGPLLFPDGTLPRPRGGK